MIEVDFEKNPELKHFPFTLRQLLKSTGTSQKCLAKHIGATKSTVSLYVCGKNNPDIERFVKIAQFFNVTYDYLLGGESARMKIAEVGDSMTCPHCGEVITPANIDIREKFQDEVMERLEDYGFPPGRVYEKYKVYYAVTKVINTRAGRKICCNYKMTDWEYSQSIEMLDKVLPRRSDIAV